MEDRLLLLPKENYLSVPSILSIISNKTWKGYAIQYHTFTEKVRWHDWLVSTWTVNDGHPEMHQWDIKYNDIIHGIDRTYAEGTLTHLSVSFSGLKFEIQTLATRQ